MRPTWLSTAVLLLGATLASQARAEQPAVRPQPQVQRPNVTRQAALEMRGTLLEERDGIILLKLQVSDEQRAKLVNSPFVTRGMPYGTQRPSVDKGQYYVRYRIADAAADAFKSARGLIGGAVVVTLNVNSHQVEKVDRDTGH